MKCKRCGLEADRDIIGAWNVRLRGLEKIDVRSPVPRESLPMKPEGGRFTITKLLNVPKVTANQNGNIHGNI